MARKVAPLTAVKVKNSKSKDGKAIKLFDGGGLFLLVDKTGNKGWRLKYRFDGKEKLISLGPYPQVSLQEARGKRDEARKLVEEHIDPSVKRQIDKIVNINHQKSTFRVLAEDWLPKQNLADSTKKMILRRLENDIYPALENIPVADVTPKIILEGVLRPVEDRGALVLVRRVKSIVGQVLRYGVACGLVERDVSADLRDALKQVKTKHRAALTKPDQVGALLRAIDTFEGTAVVKAALRLHPLTALRPGELRKAEWSEFDLEQCQWNLPAHKMKMNADHIVPLSNQAIDILRDICRLTGNGRFVFPSIRTREKPISNGAMNAGIARLGFGSDEMCPHGWRAVFRTLAEEVLGERIELIEMQLSHRVPDVHGRAYNRTIFLDERRELMQRWSNYLDLLREGKARKVIPFRKNGAG